MIKQMVKEIITDLVDIGHELLIAVYVLGILSAMIAVVLVAYVIFG